MIHFPRGFLPVRNKSPSHLSTDATLSGDSESLISPAVNSSQPSSRHRRVIFLRVHQRPLRLSRGTMKLYGRDSPLSYPLVLPYVTPALMVCLEADTPCTPSALARRKLDFTFTTLCNAHGETCVIIFTQLSSRLPVGTCAMRRYSNVPP